MGLKNDLNWSILGILRAVFRVLATVKLHVVGWLGGDGLCVSAKNRLRRFCGLLRTPKGALEDGAKVGPRVVFE